MTILSALLLTVLLGAAPPAKDAKPAQPEAAPGTVQPLTQKQVALVVRSVGQRAMPDRIKTPLQATALRVAAELRAGQVEAATARWKGLITEIRASKVPIDTEALVQWVLRRAYLEQNWELRFYADKVRFYGEAKRAIRSHLEQVKKLVAQAPGSPVTVPTVLVRPYAVDTQAVVSVGKRSMNKRELDQYIARLEKQLTTASDNAQLANVDLQKTLLKQPAVLQTMSNKSKLLHDTARAIIRKTG